MQAKNSRGRFTDDELILVGNIENPQTILDIGLRYPAQIELLQKVQDYILIKQFFYLKEDINCFSKCGKKLKKNGDIKYSFSAVFPGHYSYAHSCHKFIIQGKNAVVMQCSS
jgi:hypothetical protein